MIKGIIAEEKYHILADILANSQMRDYANMKDLINDVVKTHNGKVEARHIIIDYVMGFNGLEMEYPRAIKTDIYNGEVLNGYRILGYCDFGI